VVQGADRQDLFQVRPDTLLWQITDWSGGEGQSVYGFQNQNKHAILQNVDPFSRPGTLTPGFLTTSVSTDNVIATTALISNTHNLVLLSLDTAQKYYKQAVGGSLSALLTMDSAHGSPPTAVPSPDGADSDDRYIYFNDQTSQDIWRYDTSDDELILWNNDITAVAGRAVIRELGDYIYVFTTGARGLGTASIDAKIYEIPKAGTTPLASVELASLRIPAANMEWTVTKFSNRLFAAYPFANGYSTIVELIPTSAAGPGTVAEIARIPGIFINSLWSQNGVLYFSGTSDTPGSSGRSTRYLMSLIPGETLGAIGLIRDKLEEEYNGITPGAEVPSSVTVSTFPVQEDSNFSTGNIRIMQLDTTKGALAQVSQDPTNSDIQPGQGVPFDETMTYAVVGGSRYAYTDFNAAFEDWSHFESPWHDLGLAEEKLLGSIKCSTESIPTNWSITLSYAINGSKTFTALTQTMDAGETEMTWDVSTVLSSIKFNKLKIKAAFQYTGTAGTSTTKPVIHGIQVAAMVVRKQSVWRLLLDCSDDHSGGEDSFTGKQKITNIKTAGDGESVIELQDGYASRIAGEYSTHAVVVDSYRSMLDKPGEGVIYLELIEVV
jgi:hypothetical protein